MHPHDALPDLPTVAAVCVYPTHVATAVDALKGSGVKVAAVATAFPSGNSSRKIKLADTKIAVDAGADEVDMVISRGEYLSGNYSFVFDEIAAIKDACGKARLKVILETGELSTLDNVRPPALYRLQNNQSPFKSIKLYRLIYKSFSIFNCAPSHKLITDKDIMVDENRVFL